MPKYPEEAKANHNIVNGACTLGLIVDEKDCRRTYTSSRACAKTTTRALWPLCASGGGSRTC